MTANLRNFALWVVMVLLLLALFTVFQNPTRRPSSSQISFSSEISFSQFLDLVDRGNVRAVDIDGPEIQVSTINGETFRTIAPNDPTLVQRLHDKRVVITARSSRRPRDATDWLQSPVATWLPFLVLIGTWILLARWMRRGRAAPLDFGIRSAARASVVDDAAHWRGRAGEARAAADQLADPQSQQQMLEIARRYEYLAQRAEERRRHSGS